MILTYKILCIFDEFVFVLSGFNTLHFYPKCNTLIVFCMRHIIIHNLIYSIMVYLFYLKHYSLSNCHTIYFNI